MPEQKHFVYKLTFPNGKVYLGMSRTYARAGYGRRMTQHENSAAKGIRLPLYNAWRKHGAPKFEVLSEHATREECALAEIAAIASHESINPERGYNVMGGGEGQQAGTNPRLWAILNEKVWSNPTWRAKVSAALKGRKPSAATIAGYKEFCKTPGKAEAARIAWRNQEYLAMKSEATREQMKNGGAAHLSKLFKGRKDTLTAEQRAEHRVKMKEWANSEEGKAACRKGYDAMASNPENVDRALENIKTWRESERNAEHCKRIAQLAAKASSKKVLHVETGIVYDSQRALSKAAGCTEATISKWVKTGKVVRL